MAVRIRSRCTRNTQSNPKLSVTSDKEQQQDEEEEKEESEQGALVSHLPPLHRLIIATLP
ncbi:hypothetical protein E2C01_016730 [Portunus trituberculatus]|uniref:Uncharacterized protein n=1 Tax=Portunus trituberculatus TaxID=210409 RepID=A0A5B7DPU8_PORTR|nr:hypothetical protein [Portunus trituberculatus]